MLNRWSYILAGVYLAIFVVAVLTHSYILGLVAAVAAVGSAGFNLAGYVSERRGRRRSSEATPR